MWSCEPKCCPGVTRHKQFVRVGSGTCHCKGGGGNRKETERLVLCAPRWSEWRLPKTRPWQDMVGWGWCTSMIKQHALESTTGTNLWSHVSSYSVSSWSACSSLIYNCFSVTDRCSHEAKLSMQALSDVVWKSQLMPCYVFISIESVNSHKGIISTHQDVLDDCVQGNPDFISLVPNFESFRQRALLTFTVVHCTFKTPPHDSCRWC